MTKTNTLLWTTLLGVVAVFGSYGFACVFPFAAIAALSAMTLPGRRAAALVAAVWASNQIVGFALLHYGDGADAIVWGAVIGLAAFTSLGAAKLAYGAETCLMAPRTLAALGSAIIAYQAVMFIGAWALDGFASSTPAIVAIIVRNDILWFAGLGVLRIAATRGAPRWFGVEPAGAKAVVLP